MSRVIFAGQSGTRKWDAIQRVAEFARAKHGITEDLQRTCHKAHVLPIEFEDEMVRGRGPRQPITAFLDSFNNEIRSATWHDTFGSILKKVESSSAENVFLAMHLCLYRHSNFFTFTDWRELRAFRPDVIITLFDDIYDVWARVRARTAKTPDGTTISLKELFAWRSAEAFFAEQLSRNLLEDRVVPHYQVAVKHPPEMLEKLLFQTDLPRIYASYPITHVRSNTVAVAEINHVRARLHSEFVVFDPVTIDERVLPLKFPKQADVSPGSGQREVRVESTDRWPLEPSQCCVYGPSESGLYPVRIPVEEIAALGATVGNERRWSDIDNNIRWRDFALINQVQGVLAYRPCYGGAPLSMGVTRELNYALDTRIIPAVVFWPKEDGPAAEHPFSPNAILIQTTLDDAITALRSQVSGKEAD